MFPFIAASAAKQPQHGTFATEVIAGYTRKVSVPLAVLVPLFGTALIITKRYDFWKSEWLIISAALHLVIFLFATVVQDRNAHELLAMQRAMPPGPPPKGPSRWRSSSPSRRSSGRGASC